MQKPTEQSMTNPKRPGRYLNKRPNVHACSTFRRVSQNTQQHDGHGVSTCHVTRNQPAHSVMVKVNIMELSNAQSVAQARDPCLQILACVLTSLFGRMRRVDRRLAHAEDLVPYGTCRFVTCGWCNGCKRETYRLKEPGDTNVSDAVVVLTRACDVSGVRCT